MFTFNDNRKTINEIHTMFTKGTLVIDHSYQRRSVWNEKDKIRLVETILLNFVIPPLFFWKSDTDPETGISTTHIVDGQQRINAITEFIDNEFKLKENFLLDKNEATIYKNKFFSNLTTEEKKEFWNYQLMVIEIDSKASRADIVRMFNRLNLTDFNLNDQEKRNSKAGEFAALAQEISESTLWSDYKLFTNKDIKRMKDVEFCANIIILFRKGIIDQTDQSILNQTYDELQSAYTDAETDKNNVLSAIEIVRDLIVDDDINTFLRRKAQLYTLFSVIFYTVRTKKKFSPTEFDKLRLFVQLYTAFNNDSDLTDQLDESEKGIYNDLKRYKLASSEGLNKHTNRAMRFNILKKFMFEIGENDCVPQLTLLEKMQAASIASPVSDEPEE